MAKQANKRALVPVAECRRFIFDCFKAVHVPQNNAEQMADVLIAADYRGHFSHGMNRLERYLNDLLKKSTDGAARPKIIKQTPGTAWVDGNNGLGAVVGNFSMDLAIKKAKKVGVGWVVARRSNHYGMAGWYPNKALEAGMIGLTMTNTSPLLAPTGSKEAVLGSNPISFAARGKNDRFTLDMATTTVALGKIEIQRRKGEPIPHGWAQGPDGKSVTDAEVAFKTGCLMPLGGAAQTGGHKGYGLSAMVDILSGVLSGAKYSTLIERFRAEKTEAGLGHLFVAVNPKCFSPNFEENLADFNNRLRCSKPTNPSFPVRVPGDTETAVMKAVDDAGGIQYVENQWQTCENLAKKLNVTPLGQGC